ncbi:MAG: L-aspartate oxidase [Planctomycetes bacterium]|nr:L-aspartate oxidase [Planctomycetota bacterium]
MKNRIKPQRYLTSFNTKKLRSGPTDILVIGSGIAGLRAAVAASRFGSVTVVTKNNTDENNTFYAQGGIAGHITKQSFINSHIQDTLQTGQGLNNPATVKFIIKKGGPLIKELIKWGLNFDRKGKQFDFAREGGHSHPCILHSGGDKTGANLIRTLIAKVKTIPQIKILEYHFVIDLLTRKSSGSNPACFGALIHDMITDETKVIRAGKIILATGGIGQLYRETTNPEIATGDGLALAYRASAVLQDMEFIQFHPTAFYVAGASRALISEAVRGAGGILRDKNGHRFMLDYHPRAELAPRDIVARSMLNQMKLTNDTSVYLDLTHLNATYINRRFPALRQLCDNFDVDLKNDLIPVRPSAHYLIGGIKINRHCETNVHHLYAAGEAAASDFHGANRLGSNSLLEGLVLGKIAGTMAGQALKKKSSPEPQLASTVKSVQTRQINVMDARNSLRSLMWRAVGLSRDTNGLKEALKKINFWGGYIMNKKFTTPNGWELQNMLTLAQLITTTALKRTESRGVHYRSDFPLTQPEWKKHITVKF